MAKKKVARRKAKSRPKRIPAVVGAPYAYKVTFVERPSLFLPERYAYDSVFERMVDEELTRAREVWGPEHNQNSLHESYAVILEEVDEFWDEVKAKQSTPGRAERALKELVQIAAMCRRCAEDVLKVGFE